jgi:adenylate cyclase
MADLSGYTAMTDVHGGPSAAQLVIKYMDLVYKSLTGESHLVQRIGDQVVILSDRAEDLVETIRKLNDEILAENHFLGLHAGLHFGPLHEEDGNLFGSTINVASRILGLARRGEIFCSSAFLMR